MLDDAERAFHAHLNSPTVNSFATIIVCGTLFRLVRVTGMPSLLQG